MPPTYGHRCASTPTQLQVVLSTVPNYRTVYVVSSFGYQTKCCVVVWFLFSQFHGEIFPVVPSHLIKVNPQLPGLLRPWKALLTLPIVKSYFLVCKCTHNPPPEEARSVGRSNIPSFPLRFRSPCF